MQISFNLSPELLEKVDASKGTQSRSAFLVSCIYEHFSGGDADKMQLIRDLEAHRETQRRLEDEIAYLREQYSKINDALSQRLLTEATIKKTLWERIRGR